MELKSFSEKELKFVMDQLPEMNRPHLGHFDKDKAEFDFRKMDFKYCTSYGVDNYEALLFYIAGSPMKAAGCICRISDHPKNGYRLTFQRGPRSNTKTFYFNKDFKKTTLAKLEGRQW